MGVTTGDTRSSDSSSCPATKTLSSRKDWCLKSLFLCMGRSYRFPGMATMLTGFRV